MTIAVSASHLSHKDIVRQNLVVLMDIVFTKLVTRRFLLERANIYRVVHCATKFDDKVPLLYALLAFLLQLCLVAYISTEVTMKLVRGVRVFFDSIDYRMAPLGVIAMLYNMLIAYPGVVTAVRVYRFYGTTVGPLQLADLIVNVILPSFVVLAGLMVVLISHSYIEGVLNAAALLYLQEIDDNLPGQLHLDSKTIVENYLIREALQDLEKIRDEAKSIGMKSVHSIGATNQSRLKKVMASSSPQKSCSRGMNLEDLHLTPIPPDEAHQQCVPYAVTVTAAGPQVVASPVISIDCLFSRMEWRYTDKSSSSTVSIASLRLWKLDDDHQQRHQRYEYHRRRPLQQKQMIVLSPRRWHGSKGCSGRRLTKRSPVLKSIPPPSMTASMKGHETTAASNNNNNNHRRDDNENENDDDGCKSEWHRVEGVYIITSIHLSPSGITRLRVCGTPCSSSSYYHDFDRAMMYYSLFPVDPAARNLLRRRRKNKEM